MGELCVYVHAHMCVWLGCDVWVSSVEKDQE